MWAPGRHRRSGLRPSTGSSGRSAAVRLQEVGAVERIRHAHDVESTARITRTTAHVAVFLASDAAADGFRGIALAAMTDGVCQRLLERRLDLELAPEADLAPVCLGDALGHGPDGAGLAGMVMSNSQAEQNCSNALSCFALAEFPLQLLNEPSLSRFPQTRRWAPAPARADSVAVRAGQGPAAERSQRRPLLRGQRPRDAVDDAEAPTAWPSRVTSGDPA